MLRILFPLSLFSSIVGKICILRAEKKELFYSLRTIYNENDYSNDILVQCVSSSFDVEVDNYS